MENYYVYALLDPRVEGQWNYQEKVFEFEPFYIGKGRGKRINCHTLTSCLSLKSSKSSKIKAILEEEKVPIKVKVFEDLAEDIAFNIETEVIKHFGRKDINTGILTNHTDGGIGQKGVKRSNPRLRKKVYQYSLEGEFLKEWESLTELQKHISFRACNISTAIKRKGTCGGFIWSYTLLETEVKPKIKSQMPIKYIKIEQYSLDDELINVFSSALEAAQFLKLQRKSSNKIISCAKGKEGMKTYKGFKWKIYEQHELVQQDERSV